MSTWVASTMPGAALPKQRRRWKQPRKGGAKRRSTEPRGNRAQSPEPDAAKAEAYFQRALAVARTQQAKSWELRAATNMARLKRDQGKRDGARDLLAPAYAWFTEGFDRHDLKEAKVLLDELASWNCKRTWAPTCPTIAFRKIAQRCGIGQDDHHLFHKTVSNAFARSCAHSSLPKHTAHTPWSS